MFLGNRIFSCWRISSPSVAFAPCGMFPKTQRLRYNNMDNFASLLCFWETEYSPAGEFLRPRSPSLPAGCSQKRKGSAIIIWITSLRFYVFGKQNILLLANFFALGRLRSLRDVPKSVKAPLLFII